MWFWQHNNNNNNKHSTLLIFDESSPTNSFGICEIVSTQKSLQLQERNRPMASVGSREAIKQAVKQVRPILSLSKSEARARALNLYKAWYRQIPYIGL